MQFTISDIARVARAERGLLSAETAAFLLLSISENPGFSLCLPEPALLRLGPGGSIDHGPLSAAQPLEVDRKLRALLGELLTVSAGVTPPLLDVTTGTGASLDDFRRDLHTALVPLNRSAAQRALLRLHRRLLQSAERRATASLSAPAAELASQEPVARRPRRPRLSEAAASEVNVPALKPAAAHSDAADLAVLNPGFRSTPMPVPSLRWAELSSQDVPESVTPYLGSLELEERAPTVELWDAVWDDELLALTDRAPQVAWQTDGGLPTYERRLPDMDACPALDVSEADAAAEATPEAGTLADGILAAPAVVYELQPSEILPSETAVSGISAFDAEFSELTETARVWPLPPAAGRVVARVNASVRPAYAPNIAPAVAPYIAPYIAQYRSNAPATSKLLREFAESPVPPLEEVKQVLRRLVEETSHTPPPVATVEQSEQPVPKKPVGLAPVLYSAALLAGAAVLLVRYPDAKHALEASAARPSVLSEVVLSERPGTMPQTPVQNTSVALQRADAPAAACWASVHVETEPSALVRLFAGDVRLSAKGPHAVFAHVPCVDDARVAVRRGAASRKAEWLQVPLPEGNLRAATEAAPLLVRVFASSDDTTDLARSGSVSAVN